MIIRGEVRPIVPYRVPLVMGNEFCGIVEATGSKVSGLVTGNRVYGRMPLARTGAFADYLTIDEQDLAPVPDYLNDEEAASVPLTALTAIQALDLMQAQADRTLFVVHEDGRGLSSLDEVFDASNPLPTSVDAVFDLEDVNKALEKVRGGHSRGKTILRISA